MNTEKIKTAKTQQALFDAMDEFLIDLKTYKVVRIEDLSTKEMKVDLIIRYLKEVIDTGKFADSHGFVIVFKDDSFNQFKKYEYGNFERKAREAKR